MNLLHELSKPTFEDERIWTNTWRWKLEMQEGWSRMKTKDEKLTGGRETQSNEEKISVRNCCMEKLRRRK